MRLIIFNSISRIVNIYRYIYIYKHITRIRLSSTTYSLSILSRPSVDFLSLLAINVLFANRLNIDVFPTPYSPHRITFCSVTLTVAMLGLCHFAGRIKIQKLQHQ